ncbi:MAG: LPS export ABC transporter periplasmic protein LptC [Halobacteria archaeon]|nr:LPS export ABC transporter periplasmic protein LptC [Halobacteria archaeon]
MRLAVTALVLCLFAGVVAVVNQQEYVPGDTSADSDGPDAFAEDMTLSVMNEDGRAVYRLTAGSMSHHAGTDLLELHDPLVNITRPDGSRWLITAARGEAATSGERVWLPGAVDLRRMADNRHGAMHISASDVVVWPGEKVAETTRKAVIITDSFRVEAVGLKADFLNNRLELRSRVRGRINGAG